MFSYVEFHLGVGPSGTSGLSVELPNQKIFTYFVFHEYRFFLTTIRGKVHPGECERLAGSIFLILNQVSAFPDVSSYK